jgi:hypothetical protein
MLAPTRTIVEANVEARVLFEHDRVQDNGVACAIGDSAGDGHIVEAGICTGGLAELNRVARCVVDES